MTAEMLSARQGLDQGPALPFCYLRRLGGVTLGPSVPVTELTDLIEARYFDAQQEIRVFNRDGAWQAVRLTLQPEDAVLEDTYLLETASMGKTLTVHRILNFDADGQAYIEASCLAGWEGNEA